MFSSFAKSFAKTVSSCWVVQIGLRPAHGLANRGKLAAKTVLNRGHPKTVPKR